MLEDIDDAIVERDEEIRLRHTKYNLNLFNNQIYICFKKSSVRPASEDISKTQS